MMLSNYIQAGPTGSGLTQFTPLHQGYYPTDFIHGLLSAHCADETGKIAGKSDVNKGDKVAFKHSNPTYLALQEKGIDSNMLLVEWEVREVIQDENTGYLGLVYFNEPQNQTVLAHRSTNFKLSLTTNNFLKESGLCCDIEGVLKGRIVAHQAYGYLATTCAVGLANGLQSALSFTGHSLGAWLANLSIFYCYTLLNYKNTKSVVFDGPGSFQMIEQLTRSYVRGSGNIFRAQDLDIVEYLSVPNVVNCVNSHIGQVYTVFPDLQINVPDWLIPDLNVRRQVVAYNWLVHDLKYILPEFDPETGRPRNMKVVLAWPLIEYNPNVGVGESSDTIHKVLLEAAKYFLTDSILTHVGVNFIHNLILSQDSNTLNSIVLLLIDLAKGKVSQQQFRLAHLYSTPRDQLEDFRLACEGGYLTREVPPSRPIIDQIDEYLKTLKLSEPKMFHFAIGGKLYLLVKSIVQLFRYEHSRQIIEISEEFRSVVTVHDLRDRVRQLLDRHEREFHEYLNVAPFVGNPLLLGTKIVSEFPGFHRSNLSWGQIKFEDLEIVGEIQQGFHQKQISVVQGLPGIGKTFSAHLYSKNIETEEGFCSIWFNASSRDVLTNEYETLAEDFKKVANHAHGQVETVRYVHDVVRQNGQKVLFIFDNVTNLGYVRSFLADLPPNVRILLTTRNGKLIFDQEQRKEICQIAIKPNEIRHPHVSQTLKATLAEISANQDQSAWIILEVLALLNSNLQIPADPVKRIVKLKGGNFKQGIFQLESLSMGYLDSENVHIEKMVNSEMGKYSPNSLTFTQSGLELLEYLSYFASNFVSIARLFTLLNKNETWLDLENLTIITVDKAISMLPLVDELLNFETQGEQLSLFLATVKTHLMELLNLELEREFDEIIENWGLFQSSRDKQERIPFIKRNQLKIENVVQQLNYFKRNWEHECLPSSDEQAGGQSNIELHVVIFGGTGIGKSTLLNSLIEVPMTCEKLAIREGQKTTITVLPTGRKFAEIGNKYGSQTSKVESYLNPDGTIMYWDCPGFKDNNGVLREIRNSFYIKSLNELSKERTNCHVLITLKDSIIFDKERISDFMDYIENSVLLSLGVSNFESLLALTSSTSLVIMQSSSEESMEEYSERFLEMSDHCSNPLTKEFLKMLASPKMMRKLAFFPKITKLGSVENRYKSELLNNLPRFPTKSKQQDNSTLFLSFNAAISVPAQAKLAKFGNLLNEFAEFYVSEIAETINSQIKLEFISAKNGNIKNLKGDLKSRLLLNQSFGDADTEVFTRNVGLIGKNEDNSKLIKNVFDFLNFASSLNHSIQIHLSDWAKSLTKVQSAYEEFVREVRESNLPADGVKFEAAIISTSELQSRIVSLSVKSIWATCYVFIVDEDLELPRKDLNVSSFKWIILPDKKISLKGRDGISTSGHDGERGGDGGNFSSCYTTNVDGGIVKIDVSGGRGGNGNLNTTQLTNKILQAKSKVEILEKELKNIPTFTNISMFEDLKRIKFQHDRTVLKQKINEKRFQLSASRKGKEHLEIELGRLEMAIQSSRDKGLVDRKLEEGLGKYNAVCRYGSEINKSVVEDLTGIFNEFQHLDGSVLEEKSANIRGQLGEVSARAGILTDELNKLTADSLEQENIFRNMSFESNQEWSMLKYLESVEKAQKIKSDVKIAKSFHSTVTSELMNMMVHLESFLEKHNGFEKLNKDFAEAKNAFNEILGKLGTGDENIADFVRYFTNIQASFAQLVKTDRELDSVMASVDFIVCSRSRPPSHNRTTGKRLTPKVSGRDSFLKTFDEERKKLEKEANEFKKEYDSNKIKRELLKEMLCILIETKVAKIKGENLSETLVQRTSDLKDQLREFWKNQSWLNWFKSFIQESDLDNFEAYISTNYLKLLNGLQNAEQLLDAFEERVKRMEEDSKNLHTVNDKYTNASKEFKKTRGEYENWKQKLAFKYKNNFREAFTKFGQLENLAEKLEKAKQNEANAADKLLLNKTKHLQKILETNMVCRLPTEYSSVSDNWLFWLLGKLFLFNTKFTEKYGFSGTLGGQGGNSGNFFQFNSAFVEIIQNEGEGGESGLSLAGIYSHEHTFAWLRGILATDNMNRAQDSYDTRSARTEIYGEESRENGIKMYLEMAQAQVSDGNFKLFEECLQTEHTKGTLSSYNSQEATIQGIVTEKEWDSVARSDSVVDGILQVSSQVGIRQGLVLLEEVTASNLAKFFVNSGKGAAVPLTIGIQVLASQAIALAKSGWIDGPYEGVREKAKKGERREDPISSTTQQIADFVRCVKEAELFKAINVIYPEEHNSMMEFINMNQLQQVPVVHSTDYYPYDLLSGYI